MLLVLSGSFTSQKHLRTSTAGCLGVTLVFCFTSLGHFVETKPMAAMLPTWVPGRFPLVYITGVIELVAAFAILVPRLRRVVGWGLILMLLLLLPVNVYAAVQRVGMGGHQWGPAYLLIRVPLQAILIGWIWWYAIRPQPHWLCTNCAPDRRSSRKKETLSCLKTNSLAQQA